MPRAAATGTGARPSLPPPNLTTTHRLRARNPPSPSRRRQPHIPAGTYPAPPGQPPSFRGAGGETRAAAASSTHGHRRIARRNQRRGVLPSPGLPPPLLLSRHDRWPSRGETPALKQGPTGASASGPAVLLVHLSRLSYSSSAPL